jgi:hypothetical protein
MGLDQYAYCIDNTGEKKEIAYWRKHPNLQGWMENLWEKKGRPGLEGSNEDSPMGDFNCIPVELTSEDIDNLEKDILNDKLPVTVGFFFGEDKGDYYKEKDLQFVKEARSAIDNGLTIMYDSWW